MRNSPPKQLTSGVPPNGAMTAATPRTACCWSTPTETPRQKTTPPSPTTMLSSSVRTPSTCLRRQTCLWRPRHTARHSRSQAAT
jgi:hypothetical protein